MPVYNFNGVTYTLTRKPFLFEAVQAACSPMTAVVISFLLDHVGQPRHVLLLCQQIMKLFVMDTLSGGRLHCSPSVLLWEVHI